MCVLGGGGVCVYVERGEREGWREDEEEGRGCGEKRRRREKGDGFKLLVREKQRQIR